MKKIKMYIDIAWNIVSSLIFTGTTQLLVYPILAFQESEIKFGTILTVMGITNAVGTIFGGSLNNIRLLNWKKYKEEKLDGDFSILLLYSIIFSVLFSITGSILFRNQLIFFEILLLSIISVLIMLRSYGTVYFRIQLNYFLIMKQILYTSMGYTFGIAIYYFFSINWTLIFLIGELFSTVYLFRHTVLFKEEFTKTKNIKNISRDYLQLTSSNSIANLLLYLDRLLINPILGPANVSIYFAASIVGKMAGIVLQPLSGVLLSYLSQSNESSGWKEYKITLISSFFSGIVIFIISIAVSPLIIRTLYSELYLGAMEIYLLANLGSILSICGSLIQPILLKYCKLKWQNVIQIIYGLIYIILGTYLMLKIGINGFVYAVVIANLVRYLLMILIGYLNLSPKYKGQIVKN